MSKKYSFTDGDIKHIFGANTPIFTYDQLANITNYDIEKILNSKKFMFILYQTTPTTGHWTCLIKTKGAIEFFDPYGVEIDKQFQNGQVMPNRRYLANALLKLYNKYPITYNQYKFQELSPDVNTCGRHCIVRILLRDMDLNSYRDFIMRMGPDADASVTYLTSK